MPPRLPCCGGRYFQRLADEELKHIEFINGLLKKPDEEQAVNAVVLEADGWFEDRAEKEMLDQSLIEAMTPDIAVLRTAYLIERASPNSMNRRRRIRVALPKRHSPSWPAGNAGTRPFSRSCTTRYSRSIRKCRGEADQLSPSY